MYQLFIRKFADVPADVVWFFYSIPKFSLLNNLKEQNYKNSLWCILLRWNFQKPKKRNLREYFQILYNSPCFNRTAQAVWKSVLMQAVPLPVHQARPSSANSSSCWCHVNILSAVFYISSKSLLPWDLPLLRIVYIYTKICFLTPSNDILNKITSCNSDSSYHPYFHSFHHSPLILFLSCLSLFVFAFILSDHYCYPISFLLSSFPNSHCICVLSFYDFVFTPHVAFYQI